jgi:hypothetical protein
VLDRKSRSALISDSDFDVACAVTVPFANAVIVEGLFFPTAMRFGPDGALYVSNKGFGPPQPGENLRVTVPEASDDAGADMEP